MKSRETKSVHRNTFAIHFYINRTQTRKDGTCRVFCNVTIDGEAELIGAKIYIKPSLWIAGGGRAKGKSSEALRANRLIDKHEKTIRDIYQEIKNRNGYVSAKLIKNAFNGVAQNPTTLMKLFEGHNEEFKKRVGIDRGKAAYELYLVTCKHLLGFIRKKYNNDDIELNDLNFEFYDAFDLFLRVDKGLQQKTVHQHIYNLKKLTRRAFNQGAILRDPFAKLKPALPPLKSRHMKLEDLQKLMLWKSDNEDLQRARDLFIFATFTGLCHADLTRLSEHHIRQTEDGSLWIDIKRQKTGTDCTIKLLDIPLKIIEKYRHERTDEHIFKVYARDKMSVLLNKITDDCGIGHITFHQARHNFGTHITLSQGVPIETVSRMMGHKNISTTQIYAKVTDAKVDEDMKKLNDRSAKRTPPH